MRLFSLHARLGCARSESGSLYLYKNKRTSVLFCWRKKVGVNKRSHGDGAILENDKNKWRDNILVDRTEAECGPSAGWL